VAPTVGGPPASGAAHRWPTTVGGPLATGAAGHHCWTAATPTITASGGNSGEPADDASEPCRQ